MCFDLAVQKRVHQDRYFYCKGPVPKMGVEGGGL